MKSSVDLWRIYQQIIRYRDVAKWFTVDAYWKYFRLTLSITVLSVLSLACQVGALGIIFKYIQGIEQGGGLSFLDSTYVFRDSVTLLFVSLTGAVVLFGSNAFFRYLAGIGALQLGRKYEEYSIRRATSLVGWAKDNPQMSPWLEDVGKLIKSDPRYCGRIARILIMSVLPAMTFIATLVILIYLDPAITILVLIIVLLALPFLYRVNVRGAGYSMAMERSTSQARQVRQDMVAWNATREEPLPLDSETMLAPFYKGALWRNLEAYTGRLRAVENSTLITQLMTGAGLIVIMGFMGANILMTGEGWGILATYLIALRINLNSLSQAGKMLTSVNRFYPQISRYYRFLQDMHALPEGTVSAKTFEEKAVESGPNWRSAWPQSGNTVVLEVPATAPVWFVRRLLTHVFNCEQDSDVFLAFPDGRADDLQKQFDFPPEYTDEELAGDLSRLGIEEPGALLPEDGNMSVQLDGNDKKKRNLYLAALATVAAARSGCPIVVIAQGYWGILGKEGREAARDMLDGRTLVVLDRTGTGKRVDYGESFTLVTDGEGVLILADRKAFGKLRDLSHRLRKQDAGNGYDDLGEDES